MHVRSCRSSVLPIVLILGGCDGSPRASGTMSESGKSPGPSEASMFVSRPELGDERPSGAKDFDFLFGSWNVTNSVLRGRLEGSTDWVEWDATLDVVPILGGLGNVDRFRRSPTDEYFEGVSVRLFDGANQQWNIHWVDTRSGVFSPPVRGRFEEGQGLFYGEDEHNGTPVLVRWIWTHDADLSARWEQAYSANGGDSWELNWVMTFERR